MAHKSFKTLFFYHLRRYRKYQIIFLLMTVAGCIADNTIKYLMKLIVDHSSNMQFVQEYVILMIILLFFSDLLFKGAQGFYSKIGQNFGADIQTSCYSYVQNHSLGYIENRMTGDVVKKINTIADSSSVIIARCADCAAFFYFLAFGCVLLVVHWSLFLIYIIFALIYILVAYKAISRYKANQKFGQKLLEKYNGKITELILNFFSIKSFARESFSKNEVNRESHLLSKKLTEISFFRFFKMPMGIAIVSHFYTLFTALALLNLKAKQIITIGSFVAIMPTSIYIMSFLRGVLICLLDIFGELGKIQQAYDIILDQHGITDIKNAKKLQVSKGEIIFKNINFSYIGRSEPIFENFNLKISQNERKIGIAGKSGCGKSTLVKLIARFYETQSGDIFIDRQSIKNVTQKSLHGQISFIPQDVILFHDTILNNIKYGKKNATPKEIDFAIKNAFINDFMSELPDGYHTSVGERGSKLSGGQRQRIAIARAILKNAPILILDEATSALDSSAEDGISKAINNLITVNPNLTIIAIAHRLSTIKHMDRIIFMENGKIAEDGNFNELLAIKNGKFKELWEHQANDVLAC